MAVGTCALTGKKGTFVKSHILPRAFTDRNLDKVARIQLGQFGRRPQLKHSSWYDTKLVTREGESKLEKYDSLATDQFKKFGLCWRFFPLTEHAKRVKVTNTDFELIEIDGVDIRSLRLFFLSLLWRAAATRRPEFHEICVDVLSMKKLTKIVNGDIEPHPNDFPISLVLLTTKGSPQNQSPLREKIPMPQIAKGLPRDVKIHRFFLDGMIAHIGRKSMDKRLCRGWGSRVVGHSKQLRCVGRPYAGSYQEQNTAFLQFEVARDWPSEVTRISGAL